VKDEESLDPAPPPDQALIQMEQGPDHGALSEGSDSRIPAEIPAGASRRGSVAGGTGSSSRVRARRFPLWSPLVAAVLAGVAVTALAHWIERRDVALFQAGRDIVGTLDRFAAALSAGDTETLSGLYVPDEGTIEYGFLKGRDPSSFMDRIGYLPEERGLYKKLKIVDQLRYFAALKNVPAGEAEKRIDFWLDRMGLSAWKTKRTTDLSKGMQQKIQFISTVLHDPDLLILDEPFSGLDPVNVEFMIELLSEFRTKDKTIMFSTHQMETAERLCRDILLINKA